VRGKPEHDWIADRSDDPAELLRYMMGLRKHAKWEKIGRGGKPGANFLERFDAEDWKAIDAINEELQIASDAFAFDDELSRKFANEFARQKGRVIPPIVLAAAVITQRKNAKL
jgi:hypothetical protein